MRLREYLNEAVEDKLWTRWSKAMDRADKIHISVLKLEDELKKMQKQINRLDIDIKNKQGTVVFSRDDDTGERAWSMVRG